MAGPLMANVGGLLASLLLGFPGIEIDAGSPEDWPRRPVVLPAGWDAIEVERLTVRGRRTQLLARHGAERAELTLGEAEEIG